LPPAAKPELAQSTEKTDNKTDTKIKKDFICHYKAIKVPTQESQDFSSLAG
jgi:hypothetical protein